MARHDRVIPPGGEGKVTLEVNTDNLKGKTTKGIVIVSNDPVWPELRLLLSARVKTILHVTPEEHALVHIHQGEPWSREFMIVSTDKTPFRIKGVKSSSRFFSVTHSPIEKTGNEGGGYRLKLTASPDIPLGKVYETLKIQTDLPGTSPVQLTLFGKIEGNIAYFPDRLTFYSQPNISEGQVSNNVHFIQSNGSDLKLEEVRTNNKDIVWGIVPLEEGRSCVLALVWKGKDIEKPVSGHVFISTNDKKMPEIKIPYRVIPSRKNN